MARFLHSDKTPDQLLDHQVPAVYQNKDQHFQGKRYQDGGQHQHTHGDQGNRDDEINDHARALDELNLSKVTRGGEAAQSVYSAESSVDLELVLTAMRDGSEIGQFYYPEWNYRKSI